MNYNLNDLQAKAPKSSTWSSLGKLLQLDIARKEKPMAGVGNHFGNIKYQPGCGPLIIGRTIDDYIFVPHKNYHGVLVNCAILFCLYLVSLVSSYVQTMLMGGVGQRMLFTLRNSIFNKLQLLPVGFFQPKQGWRPDIACKQ